MFIDGFFGNKTKMGRQCKSKVKIKVFGWTAKMKNAIVSDGKEVLRVIEMATQKKSH